MPAPPFSDRSDGVAVNASAKLSRRGLQVTASWLGDGAMLDALRASAVDRGLSAMVSYCGNVARNEAYLTLRDTEIFLFCHLTNESPRCLVEADGRDTDRWI